MTSVISECVDVSSFSITEKRGEFHFHYGDLVISGSAIKLLASGSVVLEDHQGLPMGVVTGQLAQNIQAQLNQCRQHAVSSLSE